MIPHEMSPTAIHVKGPVAAPVDARAAGALFGPDDVAATSG
jgi:hypothetical protein